MFGESGHADYASRSAMAFGFDAVLKNEIARAAPHGELLRRPNQLRLSRMDGRSAHGGKLANASVVRRVTSTMALPQLARPSDIANAVVFLASDSARHITGQTLVLARMEGRLLWQPGNRSNVV